MTAALLLALLCQWPLPDTDAPTVYVCNIEAIEVNHYTDYAGNGAIQLLFWEQDRWDAKGKRFAVYKGYTRFSGAGLTLEDGKFVYRGEGSGSGIGENHTGRTAPEQSVTCIRGRFNEVRVWRHISARSAGCVTGDRKARPDQRLY